ncbi:MAG: Na+/H+ antiporter subunit G [Rhodocyclales bacterium]|nr:Na+/H+ antiporter subunit G [Rhodocyclales bacterium]
MDFVIELLVSALIVIGGAFALVGSIGLVKLPSLMTRLHAPTKATTVGVGGALIASMLYFTRADGALSIHELLITLFLFLTAPVTAHFITKSYLHLHPDVARELPPASGDCGWSTYNAVPADDAETESDRRPHE